MRKAVVGGRKGEGPRLSPIGMVAKNKIKNVTKQEKREAGFCLCVDVEGAQGGKKRGVDTSIYRFLAGVMAVERIAERSL